MKRSGNAIRLLASLLVLSLASAASAQVESSLSDLSIDIMDRAEATGSGLASKDSVGCGIHDAGCDCLDPCCEPIWTATAGAIFLQRRDPDSAVLVFNTANPAQNLNADEFDFEFHTGIEGSIARNLGCDRAVEVRYFGIDDWDANVATATTPGDILQVNTALPLQFVAGTALNASYASSLHNFEINGLRQWSDWLTLSAGFRYAELDENLRGATVGAAIPVIYNVAARNRLFGGQLGCQASLWDRGGPLVIEAFGKAGLFGNRAAQNSFVTTGVVTFPASGRDNRTAFIGETGINALYRLTERISLQSGYRVMWINGLALASDQIAATRFFPPSTTSINSSGDVFYHGAFVGLQLTH